MTDFQSNSQLPTVTIKLYNIETISERKRVLEKWLKKTLVQNSVPLTGLGRSCRLGQLWFLRSNHIQSSLAPLQRNIIDIFCYRLNNSFFKFSLFFLSYGHRIHNAMPAPWYLQISCLITYATISTCTRLIRSFIVKLCIFNMCAVLT